MKKTKNPWGMDSNGTVTEKARAGRFASHKRGVHGLPQIPGEAFYSAQELADELRVNIMTIYRYIKAGKIVAYKFGKEFRIDRDEFEKFLHTARTKN